MLNQHFLTYVSLVQLIFVFGVFFFPSTCPKGQRCSQQLASPDLTVAKLGAVLVRGTAGEGREAGPERKEKVCTLSKAWRN